MKSLECLELIENLWTRARLKTEMAEMKTGYEGRIGKLEGRVAELEGYRIKYNKGSYTLKSFNRLVSSTVEKECHARINHGVEVIWAAESPRMVRKALNLELSGYPDKCSPQAKTAIESVGKAHADTILHNKLMWPPWFRGQVEEEVNGGIAKGLDNEFQLRVDAQASNEIQRRESYAWPKFIREKVSPQFQGSLVEQLRKLNTTLRVVCDRCGTPQDVPVGSDLIAQMITQQSVSVSCCNPSCRDIVFHHSYLLTLGQLILAVTGMA